MTILRRYGRGLRIVGQTLEVDFGTDPGQVPEAGSVVAAPSSSLLLSLRAVARRTARTAIQQTHWRATERTEDRAVAVHVLARAMSEKSPLRFWIYNLTRGRYLALAEKREELLVSSVETTLMIVPDVRSKEAFDPSQDAILEVQIATMDPSLPAVLERAELL